MTLLAILNESPSYDAAEKSKEAEYITALMNHVRLIPTSGILQELQEIRLLLPGNAHTGGNG